MFNILYSIITLGGDNLYRKSKSSDTWHFCRNCSRWPTSNYDERYTKPTTGELCNECKSKQINKNCRK